jgi:threonine/homoserine/homoserine lactone efflux protein
MSVAFLLTSLAIVATPGTGVLLTTGAGLRGGQRHALVTAVGCTLGIVPHLAAAVTGTAAVLRTGGVAFEVLRIAGIAYLVYLAWSTWRDSGIVSLDTGTGSVSVARTIGNAVLANLLNPKLTLFFFAFLPQFVAPGSGQLAQMLLLSGVFMVMTLLVFSAYGWFAAAMRRHVISRPAVVRRIRRFLSLGYLALGARLVTTER